MSAGFSPQAAATKTGYFGAVCPPPRSLGSQLHNINNTTTHFSKGIKLHHPSPTPTIHKRLKIPVLLAFLAVPAPSSQLSCIQ